MKKLSLYVVFCCLITSLQAQSIEGTVYDDKTKEPITGVVVYLNGTSIITTSDQTGHFKLLVENEINTTLVFSHLSYEPLVINNPFKLDETSFFLKEKQYTLSEVTVIADRYSRADKLKVFKEQFLGKSAAGKSCIIQNEEVLVLNYDNDTYTLSGYAVSPLIIENKYLAYQIHFDLQSFTIQYSKNTLNTNRATIVSYKGNSSFIDQNPNSTLYARRRGEVYLRSSQYFWKNFVEQTLTEAKFKTFHGFKMVEAVDGEIVTGYQTMELDKYFDISDLPPQKVVSILPETNISRTHISVQEGTIYGVIRVLFNNKFSSEVVFLTDRFLVDSYGNPNTIEEIIFFGEMGKQRLGELLPQNYIYNPQLFPMLK